MAMLTVQIKGVLKTVQKSNEKKENQINDVCLNTNDRLFIWRFVDWIVENKIWPLGLMFWPLILLRLKTL